jgi:hypothetical protein
VTELEPSRSFTWVATGPGVRTTARHLLEEPGSGGTRVTLAVEQAGPVGRVMGRFYRCLNDRARCGRARTRTAAIIRHLPVALRPRTEWVMTVASRVAGAGLQRLAPGRASKPS